MRLLFHTHTPIIYFSEVVGTQHNQVEFFIFWVWLMIHKAIRSPVGGWWWAVPETPTRNLAGVFFLVPLSSCAADLVLFLMREVGGSLVF
jgi:hypothetical protein